MEHDMKPYLRYAATAAVALCCSAAPAFSAPAWQWNTSLATGNQMDVAVGPDNTIHLATSKYWQFNTRLDTLALESKYDYWQGDLTFPPAVAVDPAGTVHLVTREGTINYDAGALLRYRQRSSAGTWTDGYFYGTKCPRNYVVGVAAADAAGKAVLMHTTTEGSDNVWGEIRFFESGATAATQKGTWETQGGQDIWRADADARIRGRDGRYYFTSGCPDPSGRVFIAYADASGGDVLTQFKANAAKHTAGTGRRAFGDVYIDGTGTAHLVYGAYQTVHYNRYDGTSKAYGTDKTLFSDLREWHLSTGLATVAASDDGGFVCAAALKSDESEYAANAEILWTLSDDGGDTWSTPQGTGKFTNAGEGRRRPRLVYADGSFYLFYRDNTTYRIGCGVLNVAPARVSGRLHTEAERTPSAVFINDLPNHCRITGLDGRPVHAGSGLRPGLYLVETDGRTVKAVITE